MSVIQALQEFADAVVKQSKANLKNKGELAKSVSVGTVKVSKNSIQVDILMNDYGVFYDKGVKGKSKSDRAPNSPFKFGTGTGRKGGLTEGLIGWVQRKRIQFRYPSGRFMSTENTAFLIRRAVWHKGLKTTNFFTTPFEKEFAKLPDKVIEKYGLEVEDFLKYTLK